MKTIEIYDPQICNSSNGCGSGADREALRIKTMLRALTSEGKKVLRYGLIENPDVFARNKEVSEIISKHGLDVLPITVVDGEIIRKGSYPSNLDLATWSGMTQEELVLMLMKTKMTNRSFCGGDCC
ncbi:MAG: arsenic metallochaperone ArsD family protein [Acetobacterium sp.]|uniref:arsenite efflux transporter metallochaperone ArsD n=1 Tax=Acetobacterium sp. TaxID=1872094 RepID=UPI0032425828